MGWKNNRLYGTERARGIYIYIRTNRPTARATTMKLVNRKGNKKAIFFFSPLFFYHVDPSRKEMGVLKKREEEKKTLNE